MNELDIKIYEKVSNLKPKFIGNCDVIFSVGYLKKIESEIIQNYEIINLHPSLLPKYKGLMTHKRMLINNEIKYGYSIHKVTKYLDDGEILSQNHERDVDRKDAILQMLDRCVYLRNFIRMPCVTLNHTVSLCP